MFSSGNKIAKWYNPATLGFRRNIETALSFDSDSAIKKLVEALFSDGDAERKAVLDSCLTILNPRIDL